MAGQTYEQAMRQEARRLVAEHGDLVEVRCISGPPDFRIELQFTDGHEEVVTEHSGHVDISMMKFGYAGTGTSCLWAFLDEAGFEDVSQEQLQTMEGPQVLRKAEPPQPPGTQEEVPVQKAASYSGKNAEPPQWEDVSRDPSLLHPLVLADHGLADLVSHGAGRSGSSLEIHYRHRILHSFCSSRIRPRNASASGG